MASSQELAGEARRYDDFGIGRFYFPKNKRRIVIEGYLGGGTFGKVFKASTIRKVMAVKLLKITNHWEQEEAKKEAIMLERLSSSDFTPKFFGSTQLTDCVALEIELLGPSLWDLTYKEGSSFSASQMFTLAKELLSALAYLHKRGLVHCDVKTPNICCKTPQTKGIVLVDLGGVRELSSFSSFQKGRSLATLPYESPEALFGLNLSEKVDIWAAGITLAEVLTGRLPFAPESKKHDFKVENLVPETASESLLFKELSEPPFVPFKNPPPFTNTQEYLIEEAKGDGWNSDSKKEFVELLCKMLTPESSARPSA